MMNRIAIATLAVAASLGSAAFAAEGVIYSGGTPTLRAEMSIGSPTQTHSAGLPPTLVASGAAYSNVTTFGGSAVANTGATTGNLATFAIADDLTTNLASPTTLKSYSFSIANFNTAVKTIKPSIRFFDDDGASGGPGTLLGGQDFNAVSVNAGSIGVLSFNIPAAQQFTLPTGTVWALQYFTGGSGTTSTTAAQVNNIGMALFNPPDVGTSSFNEWDSNAAASASAASFVANNPDGFIYTGGYSSGATPANFGFELVVPEPTTLAALGAAGLVFGRRRKA